MLWGSDRYSNPVQMVVEGWLSREFSSLWYFFLVKLNTSEKLWTGLLHQILKMLCIGRWQTLNCWWKICPVDRIDRRNCRCYVHTYVIAMENSLAVTPKNFCDSLDLSGMLIQHSGILLALSLSCGYNLEVCAVEPSCTRVKAETGDKALTSWWVVKLGRNQLWPMIYKFVWFILLQMLLWLLCYFGCYVTLVASCIYVQLWMWSVCSYYVICSWNM